MAPYFILPSRVLVFSSNHTLLTDFQAVVLFLPSRIDKIILHIDERSANLNFTQLSACSRCRLDELSIDHLDVLTVEFRYQSLGSPPPMIY